MNDDRTVIDWILAALGNSRRKIRAAVDGHPRLLIAAFALSILVVVKVLLLGPGDVEPSSSTTRVAWEIFPNDGVGQPIVRFEIDQSTGWLRFTDSRSPGRQLFVHDGMVITEANLDLFGFAEFSYVAIPVELLFPPPIVLTTGQIAPSLDRGARECTFPSPIEDAYVRFFLGSASVDLTAPYAICGRASFENGSGRSLVRANEVVLEGVGHPPADVTLAIDRLGAQGESLIAEIKREFPGFE